MAIALSPQRDSRTGNQSPRQKDSSLMWRDSFSSPMGWIAWQGTERGVTGLTLGNRSQSAAEAALPHVAVDENERPRWWKKASKVLRDYCQGEPVDLTQIPVDVEFTTSFSKCVVEALLKVSYGETVSYQELADLAGSPHAARAVGTVMSKNRIPLIIPCHRVVGAGGKLGGYSAPQGVVLKQALLEMESGTESRVQPSAKR